MGGISPVPPFGEGGRFRVQTDRGNSISRVDISGLSVAERLEVMEAIWDSLIHEGEEVASPDWHRAVVDKRQRRIDAGEARFLPMAELKARRRR